MDSSEFRPTGERKDCQTYCTAPGSLAAVAKMADPMHAGRGISGGRVARRVAPHWPGTGCVGRWAGRAGP